MKTETQTQSYGKWCRSPFGIVILVVLAIAFGGHLALQGNVMMTIATGTMLFSHLALILLGLYQEKKKKGTSPTISAP